MALRLVRQTSDTPNITNKDDVVSTRYSYGGYNGVVKSFGSECGYIAENGIFKILDGRIVIDGWEIDNGGEGWSLDLHYVSGTQYHSIYVEIDVSTESVILNSIYLSGSYPEIPKGDNLTETQNGKSALLLYGVKVENGIITEVVKRFEIIPYLAQKVLDTEQKLAGLTKSLEDGSIKPKIALYASEDTSKGTIEERLTNLGFKEGNATINPTITSSGVTQKITRQGNYVIGSIYTNTYIAYKPSQGVLFTLPEMFKPKETQEFWVGIKINSGSGLYNDYAIIKILDNGEASLTLNTTASYVGIASFNINFGFEAPPIIEV